MAAIPSFIFGAGTKYKTQEELDRAREQVKALLGDIGKSKFTGWGSALADLGKGISAGIEGRRINEGQEGLSAKQSKLWEMFGGGGYSGADPDAIVATSGADTLPVGSAGTDPVAQALARPPESSAPRGGGGDYLRYANQGATRNKPLAPKLEKALGFLSDLGVTAEVFSGGQDASGPHRTGSHRHDYGNAGDIRFYKDGRPLSWANKADLPLFQEIVRRGKAAGITGFGAGPGYMGEGTMHVGFGTPSVWGAGGRSRNAPGWLTDAYSGRLVGGGGASGQAGGGAGDSFLQAKPRRRMTPAMLEQEAGTEARPLWDDSPLAGRRRMTPAMTGIPDAVPPAVPAAPSPLDDRRRMTPAMLNPAVAPAPMPAPDPARFGPTPPPAPFPQPQPARFGGPTPFVPPAPQIFTPPAAPTGNRLGSPPPSMAGTETAPYPVPGMAMAGTETVPYPQPAPAPRPVPPPAPAPVPPAPPAPPPQVDPFTDMILGDKAAQFKPGNYIPPAPVGKQVFPAAPPAPGTPAAAGFGVPPVVGGGGADQLAGKGTFPPAPAPPQAQQAGGGDKIAKLMFVLSSPYASDEQKRMATAMLQREYALEDERRKAASPEAMLDMEYKRAQIDKLNQEAAAGGSDERFFGNPILINREGQPPTYGIYGDKGTFKEIKLPPGATVAPPTKAIDTGTETIIVDQAGNVISRQPKQLREAEKEKAAGTVEGKTEGEVAAELDSITSKMPGVRETVSELGKLADAATYTQGGQLWDTIREETGQEPREASIARTKYNSVLNNQILPLLKETFGPQFTDAEGLRLQATLGDPDVAPAKKHAALEAFLAQREKDIAALQKRAGKTSPAGGGGGGAGTPPEGVSQRAWDKMTPEQRALWP
jgi:hypothetical protein